MWAFLGRECVWAVDIYGLDDEGGGGVYEERGPLFPRGLARFWASKDPSRGDRGRVEGGERVGRWGRMRAVSRGAGGRQDRRVGGQEGGEMDEEGEEGEGRWIGSVEE